jgi:hypothetical protein
LYLNKRIESSSHAIASFIDIMKNKFLIEFDLLILGNDENLKIIANRIIQLSSAPLKVIFDRNFSDKVKEYHVYSNKSSILIAENSNFVMKFNAFDDHYVQLHSTYFLVYCPYEILDNDFRINSSYGYERLFNLAHTYNGNITLIGQGKESETSCKRITKSINTFMINKRQWKSKTFILKQDDRHGCNLTICVYPILSDQIFLVSRKIDDKNFFGGFSTNLLPLLKDKMKLQGLNYEYYEPREGYKCDILLHFHPANDPTTSSLYHDRTFVETYPVYYAQNAFIVTKGLSYSPMEKLILPFDLETWMMIFLTFVVGYFTIFVIYRFKRNVRNFVFGTFMNNPSLTMTSIFFGIGMNRVPTRNFARYIFMAFTLYCLVIRTAYQGKMFEFLHIDIKKPTATSVEDLINMKIPVLRFNDSQWIQYIAYEDRKLTIKVLDYESSVELANSHIKYENESFAILENKDAIFVGAKKVVKFLDKRFAKQSSYVSKMFSVIETSKTYTVSWLAKRSSFLIEGLNKFLLEAEQHGFTDYLYNLSREIAEPSEPSEPKVLTMDILSAGFVVWIMSVSLACLVFISEHIVYFIRNKKIYIPHH